MTLSQDALERAQDCFRLYCTPALTQRISADDRAALERARSKLQSFNAEHHQVNGMKLASYAAGESQAPQIWLLHGWSGNAAAMLGFVRPLLKAGFGVRLIDLPAHGGSDGPLCSAPLTAGCLRGLAARLGAPLVLVTHSFASLAAAFALSPTWGQAHKLGQTALVTIAGLNDIEVETLRFARSQGLETQAELNAMLATLEKHAERPLGSMSAAQQIGELRAPVLAIHSKDDERAPVAHSIPMSKHLPKQSRTLVPETGGHQKILYQGSIIKAVTAFATEAFNTEALNSDTAL